MNTVSIQHIRVSSSNIRSIGYDECSSILEVRFHGGGLYQHYDIPASLFDDFLNAGSKGGFYYRRLRNRYGCRRISS